MIRGCATNLWQGEETTILVYGIGAKMKVTIKGAYYGTKTLPSLNDYLAEQGRHPKAGGKQKNDYMWVCIGAIRKCLKCWKVTNPPIILKYDFYEPKDGHARDIGNILGEADKLFEDALQACKVIGNDNPAWVIGIQGFYHQTDGEPYIEIEIEERGNNELVSQ